METFIVRYWLFSRFVCALFSSLLFALSIPASLSLTGCQEPSFEKPRSLVRLGESLSVEGNPSTHLIRKNDVPSVEKRYALMGTEIVIEILTRESSKAERAIERAFDEMKRIEALMSEWRESSDVSLINQNAGGLPVEVAPELVKLLDASKRISVLTEGKFDVTFAGAGDLWDFKSTDPSLPDPLALRSAMERVDYRKMIIDELAHTVFLMEQGMKIGLGGIAKGYAVDRAVECIENSGFHDFAVNAGGDLTVRGLKDEKLWWVGVRDPRLEDEFAAILPVSNLSVVTSGDYERYFELEGERFCHIIDTDTGYPAKACQSVTIMANHAYFADAFATGVFVLGPRRGMALIESLPGVEGMIIDAEGLVHVSKGLTHPSDG